MPMKFLRECLLLGAHRFLEGFLEGSLKEIFLRRVLRGRLVRVQQGKEF